MIARMKKTAILCLEHDRDVTLNALRDLGAVQLDFAEVTGDGFAAKKEDLEKAVRAVRIAEKAARETVGSGERPNGVEAVLALDAKREELKTSVDQLSGIIRKYEPYGDFDPVLAQKLLDYGVDFSGIAELPNPLPKERLSVTKTKLTAAERKISAITAALALTDTAAIRKAYPGLQDAIEFEVAAESMRSVGEICAITGWVPEDSAEKVKIAAKANGWGVAMRDAAADETPPTLIRPMKLFRPVTALFEALGIAPAYNEADVSVPFMCYFSLFFAMLVGDGGYGAIFLGGTLWGWKKFGRSGNAVAKSWLALMTVFSIATIGWGLLSNTWFGAGIPACADWPTVKWLADPSYNNMMLLCFTIGVSHLALARIWSGIATINDTVCLSQFGWAGIVVFMYLVTNSIVGIFPGVPTWGFWMFGISLALVFLFSLKPGELKSRGIELGMLPLNIMSALGDIISYVRLFAVGLASVKVAENFNSMAVGLDLPIWIKWLPLVAILTIGHGLNLAMAGLSILVHAVRLNTLEFSNHKGISWSGYAFKPFRKN